MASALMTVPGCGTCNTLRFSPVVETLVEDGVKGESGGGALGCCKVCLAPTVVEVAQLRMRSAGWRFWIIIIPY